MLLNLRQLGVRTDDTTDFELVNFRHPRVFSSQGYPSSQGLVFNHNFTGEDSVSDA